MLFINMVILLETDLHSILSYGLLYGQPRQKDHPWQRLLLRPRVSTGQRQAQNRPPGLPRSRRRHRRQTPTGRLRPPKPQATVRDFGAVAALFDLARRLRLAEIIDRHLPKRGPGPSVGTYLLVAVLNRCLDPCSKSALAAWFQRTVLDRLLPLQPSQLSSQRFWDNMDRVSPDAIQAIERTWSPPWSATSGSTCATCCSTPPTSSPSSIPSTWPSAATARRAAPPCCIVGLALLVSADSHLPLLHATYAGNRPDAPTFQDLCSRLTERAAPSPTRSNPSPWSSTKATTPRPISPPSRPVPSTSSARWSPPHYPDLLATPPDQLRDLASDGLPGVRARRAIRTLYGIKRTLVVTYNENLYAAQTETSAALDRHARPGTCPIRRTTRALARGKVSGGRPPSLQGVTGKVNGWLRARHMRDLFSVEIGEEGGLPTLTYAATRPPGRTCGRPCSARRSCSPTTTTGAMPISCAAIAPSTISKGPSAR